MVAGAEVERRVVDGEVDAGFEGSVECCNAVRGEEQATGVVFQQAEKDCECMVRSGLRGGSKGRV